MGILIARDHTVKCAFVNFVSHEAAEECFSRLNGFTDWATPCEKSLSVCWSENDQGLATLVDRHRDSSVMHESVRDEFKPALYKDGVRATFPRPTKYIKPPPTKYIKPPRVQRENRDVVSAENEKEEC